MREHISKKYKAVKVDSLINREKHKRVVNKRRQTNMNNALCIHATPVITGEYAKEIIAEAFKKPSKKALERNRKASDLLKKLKG